MAAEKVLGKFNLKSNESVSGYMKGDFKASLKKDHWGRNMNKGRGGQCPWCGNWTFRGTSEGSSCSSCGKKGKWSVKDQEWK